MTILRDVEIELLTEQTKVIVAEQIQKDFLLSPEEMDKWCAEHCVIFRKAGVFRTISNWFSREVKRTKAEGTMVLTLVKMKHYVGEVDGSDK